MSVSDSTDGDNGTSRKRTARSSKHCKDNIKVAVRCRPLLSGEKPLCEIVCNGRKNQIGVVIPRTRGRDSNKLYTYDKVYASSTTQSELFTQSIEPIITDVLAGYNCTVFAYGQTGSGKTYTMEGGGGPNGYGYTDSELHTERKEEQQSNTEHNDEDGIIPRAIKSIFYQLERDGIESTVIVSHLEIYNEELQDLLSDDDGKKKLVIYNDTKRSKCQGVFVQGLEEVIVSSPKQIFDILAKSTKKRITAATMLNLRSSRSHCIFTIAIRMKTMINTEEIVKTGTLNLVDLAGSESIARSGAENERAKEAGHINTSLLTLGRVISALVERRQHIPYRESKLTRLLQESLGGRNKTLLIATIAGNSPLEQTLSTLDYALRAKSIQNKPTLNVSMTKEKYVKELQVLINNYKKQIDALRSEKGIILPPEQFDKMNKTMEKQAEELEKIHAQFENERNKLLEISELFTKTNERLHVVTEEKDSLMEELDRLSDTLRQITVELHQHQYAVQRYQSTEQELRAQAENVRNVLQSTINHRDILFDKIHQRHNIEQSNVMSWNERKQKITSMLSSMQKELDHHRQDYNDHVVDNLNCINVANENIQSLKKLTQTMSDSNRKQTKQKVMEIEQLRKSHIADTLCKEHLNELQNAMKSDHNEIGSKYMQITTEIIPTFVNNVNHQLSSLQSLLNELNENLQKMYIKQNQDTNGFVRRLNGCIEAMTKQLDLDCTQQTQFVSKWQESHESMLHQCKQFAMSEISKIFDEIGQKQRSSFRTQSDQLQQRISSQYKQLNDKHLHSMTSTINEYEQNQAEWQQSNQSNTKQSVQRIQENMQSVSNQTMKEWTSNMQSNMTHLSRSIQQSFSRQQQYISNEIQQNLNEFNTKSAHCYEELVECVDDETANIENVSQQLTNQQQTIEEHRQNMERYFNEQSVPYFNQLASNLDFVQKESDIHQIAKYQKTGQTPMKQDVIYPTRFIETEPLTDLIAQFNEEHNKENQGNNQTASESLARLKSRSTTKSSSPFYIKEEVEINFVEKELGFSIKSGERDKNCFIAHCHSDPRVCDDAQIIAIDGIDVVDKSMSYIRTLLATEQRPILIKFKNRLNETDGDSQQENGLHSEEQPPSQQLQPLDDQVNLQNITISKKRQRQITKPKVMKLNYATPDKKRQKKVQTLSPITSREDGKENERANDAHNMMDVDVSDIE